MNLLMWMPVWNYTHSITNVGGGELYTQVWINEYGMIQKMEILTMRKYKN
ncbi:hypothetical protein NXW84_12380 [Bacteroides fragilis]|nr:hypothetical protein NXW84_12380 [Bacteroides fragilis]